jgi:hypothetical protein
MRPFDFPQRATEAAAGTLAGPGSDRRDFLVRVAAFGAACAARPLNTLLRPPAAQASHCADPGCQSGYSVFCCSLTGKNACPDFTFPGGWWYASVDTATCGSGYRYYLDCVGYCPEDCSGCVCLEEPPIRRVCCNNGYTNCGRGGHLHCRIVRCDTNPALLWPECSSVGTQDQATCGHGSPCLGGSKCA